MPLTSDELNNIVNTETARFMYLSLHTAAPDATGSAEVADTTYARQPNTWNPAANGAASGQQTAFNCDPATFTHFGFWDSATGGTFFGAQALDAPATLTDAGVVKVTPNFQVTSS